MGCSEAALQGGGGRQARAPSVHVSCSRLILQLIKPNIPDGVSVGLLGAGPLPHYAGTGRQEGQVGGERKGSLPEPGRVSRRAPEDVSAVTSNAGWTAVTPSNVAKLCSPRAPADGHPNLIPNGRRPTGERLLTSSVRTSVGGEARVTAQVPVGGPRGSRRQRPGRTLRPGQPLTSVALTSPLGGTLTDLPSWKKKAGPLLSPGSTKPPRLAFDSALEVHRLHDLGLSLLGQVDPKPRTLSTTVSQVGWSLPTCPHP